MTGLQSCRRLRNEPVTLDTFIVIITAKVLPANITASVGLGVNEFIVNLFQFANWSDRFVRYFRTVEAQIMNMSLYARPVMDHQFEKTTPGIALVAHDARKQEMIEWARFNRSTLSSYTLYTTGTTGALIARELDLRVHRLLSGPYGGDAQIGALVAERRVRCVIFFWDPLTPQPHDVDVKALLRLTVLHNVPTACNRVTADFLISSPLFAQSFSRREESDFLEVQRDCDLTVV